MGRGLQEWQLKQLVVVPLVRRINQHAKVSLKFDRKIFKTLKDIEDTIEIIARETARQLKPKQ